MKNVCFGFFAGALLVQAAVTYRIQARYPLPGSGGWDYVTIDSAARRLYISHATQVEVVDADSGKMVGTIPDTPGVHGIAIASEFKHGFTSNGRENKVSMFDPATLKLIKKIDVGSRAGRHLLRSRDEARLHQQPRLPQHHARSTRRLVTWSAR